MEASKLKRSEKKPLSSLRARTLLLITISLVLSSAGFFLLWGTQDKVLSTSKQLHSEIMPGINLLENVRRELDLQIREIQLVSALADSNRRPNRLPHLALVRLGPSSRSLLVMETPSHFRGDLREEIEAWKIRAENYSMKVPTLKSELDALYDLRRLRDQINLTHRKLKNTLSIRLLTLSQQSSQAYLYWLGVFILTICLFTILLFCLWSWLKPLEKLVAWFRSDNPEQYFPSTHFGSGFWSPPREIKDLFEAIESKVKPLQDFARQTKQESDEAREHQRSVSFLLVALNQLGKKNQELIDQLVKREKLASMGEMAAQLAHEIRNPLNSMNLKLELLLEDLPQGNQKAVEAVIDEIDRLDALTESYLRSTRDQLKLDSEKEVPLCRSVALFEEVTELFQNDLEQKQIHVEFSGEDFPVPLPNSVAKAVLLNLVKNSIEAIDDAEAERILRFEFNQKGSHWSITLLDTGCGFPDSYLEKPFELFQTSKTQGNGLGLATAKKMLEAYGVRIRLAREQGRFRSKVTLDADPQKLVSASQPPLSAETRLDL